MIPPTGAYAAQLLADCQTFSRYVADAGFVPPTHAGAPALTSALHVEMHLWAPTSSYLPKKYKANAEELNTWRAMRQMLIVDTFSPVEIATVFASIRTTFPTLLPGQCARSVFDAWHSNLINSLRANGLAKPRAIGATVSSAPTTLATLGLAQKVVNIYLKYALCWEVAGRYQNAAFTRISLIPNIRDFTCALHAPIDAILINKLRATKIGQEWIREGFLHRSMASILQANGSWAPWTKLECPQAYMKFQEGFRLEAEKSWPKGCACVQQIQNVKKSHPQRDISEPFTTTINPPEDTTMNTPEDPIEPLNPNLNDTICISGGPVSFYSLKKSCNSGRNAWGALERKPLNAPDGTLCLKSETIEIIERAGGNFMAMPGWNPTDGGTRRCAGTGYAGWLQLGSTQAAIEYLQKYFVVCACDEETNAKLVEDGAKALPICR
jgi:hypothetical protein